jgi:hypothetical protein
MYQERYQTLVIGFVLLVLIGGCEPDRLYRTQEMSLDLNGCINTQICEETIFNQTTLGCYITQEQSERTVVRRNQFQVGDDGTLIFTEASLNQSVGDRFIGSLFFLNSAEQGCDAFMPASNCGAGCLLRLRHGEVTVGNRLTAISFSDGMSCELISENEEVINACTDINDLDMGGEDMGGEDMGGEDMGDMNMGGVDMEADCDVEQVGTECEVEGIGACGFGTYVCEDRMLVCIVNEPSDERCDSSDNDCDGNIDEELGGDLCQVGVGACETSGVLACIGGVFSCATLEVPMPTADDRNCDGIDDDCDGFVDEDYQETNTSCGQGACAAIGLLSCVAGIEVDSCAGVDPGNPQDDLCDNIDSDCDGRIDEAFVATDTQCGRGVCAATGRETCENGFVVNSCVEGEPAIGETDQSCNLSDDDCDGRIDEAYPVMMTSCGFGVCASNGQRSCQNGVEMDSCTTLPATEQNDQICDGIDGDCDGRLDEGYAQVVSTCGNGVCQRFGVVSCTNGTLSDDCTEGLETRRDDPTCNRVDEDCDGRVDEDFIPYASPPCGEGLCEQQGQFTCQEGILVNDCTPLVPQTNQDITCDNTDEDCDGQVDEDYPTTPTNCGIGECSSTGEIRCDNGAAVDTCEPITFTGAINDDCDGLDNDCDTRVDEDFSSQVVGCDLNTSCVGRGFSTCINEQLGDTCDQPATRDSDGNGVGDPCSWVSSPSLPFDILRHEVTFGAYRDCVESGGCSINPINYNVVNETDHRNGCVYIPETEVSNEPETNPFRCINNNQLDEYCEWIGGRLPTRDEQRNLIQPTFGDFDCNNSNGGACPGASGLPEPVCSLEQSPGDFEICDLGGNVYEMTSSFLPRSNGGRYIYVCFEDFTGGNDLLNSCATQADDRLGPIIGGRCVRD